MARKLTMDRWMVGVVLLLTLFGLVMVYSSSAMLALSRTDGSTHYLLKQMLAAALGLGLFYLATRFDYRHLRHQAVIWLAMTLCLMLLAAVLVAGSRWLNLGGFSFQPSELTKLVLLIYLADYLVRKREKVRDLRGFLLPCLGVLLAFCALIVMTPDLGTTVTIMLIALCLFFMAGVPKRYLAAISALGALAVLALAWISPYRWARLISFLDPERDPQGASYQAIQSLTAVGAGGVAGAGLGQSGQKLFFLPEADTDFIYAVIGEELGLIGCLLLVTAFLVLLWRGTRIALRAPEPFGTYLAAGITLSLVLQAFINMGVVLTLLPTKGLTLPFISYGGSSLMVSLLAAGLALNVSQHGT
ncbi:MAG: putative lipid II flippase FtsW [Acidobacteria bacterium]|nr:putative lipid II flippase FtsW [Acidobacteriota bacterium]